LQVGSVVVGGQAVWGLAAVWRVLRAGLQVMARTAEWHVPRGAQRATRRSAQGEERQEPAGGRLA